MSNLKLKTTLQYMKFSYDDEGFVIHMLTSSERTFLTNAYIIETRNALVAVDTMMTNSDALLLRQHINKISKPLIAVIITHGHPDHYNGIDTIILGFNDVPIISTKGVRDCIKNTVDSKEIKWKPYFGKDWPTHKILPNKFVKNGEIICLDGLSYQFSDLGAAESSSDLFFTLGIERSVVFVGDVVFNKTHGFMNDGNSKQWLTVLNTLLVDIVDVKQLFTGHGKPGNSKQLIKEQIEYINNYRANLCKLINNCQTITDKQRQVFERSIIDIYPQHQLTAFIKAGIDAVTKELKLESCQA